MIMVEVKISALSSEIYTDIYRSLVARFQRCELSFGSLDWRLVRGCFCVVQ